MTAMTSEITYGAKITSRMNVRPGNLRFSSSAITRAIGPWITRASPRIRVCSMACMNAGSLNAIL